MLADSKLGNPYLWSCSYESLDKASPGFDLSASLIDFYLLQEAFAAVKSAENGDGQRHAYYLDLSITTNLLDGVDNENVRNTILWPTNEPIQKQPVLFLIRDTTHCNLILFDYNRNEAFMFVKPYGNGPRDTNMCADWDAWMGECYWKAIALKFGWVIRLEQPKVIEPNWNQVN
jgi:hypothetical protein